MEGINYVYLCTRTHLLMLIVRQLTDHIKVRLSPLERKDRSELIKLKVA
jgi:hypothetical protein